MILIFVITQVCYSNNVQSSKIDLVGTPVPFLKIRITVDNDTINHSGNVEVSKRGDYQQGTWRTRKAPVSFSFPGLIRKEAEETLHLAFVEKIVSFGRQKEKSYSLQLSWNTIDYY
jgi:hypothetical protein